MIEDKLNKDERVRLEALAQANAMLTMKPGTSAEVVLTVADRFENYILNGKES